jgi:hypothetical protein
MPDAPGLDRSIQGCQSPTFRGNNIPPATVPLQPSSTAGVFRPELPFIQTSALAKRASRPLHACQAFGPGVSLTASLLEILNPQTNGPGRNDPF